MDEQPSLSAEVRASLPPLVQGYLAFLDSQIGLLQEQIASLQADLAKLRLQLADANGQTAPSMLTIL